MQDINKLIEENKGLVFLQLNKFYLVDDPEAESLAYEALYNAIINYDETKGVKLSTVATVYIYNALGGYVRKLKAKRQIQPISYNSVSYTDEDAEHELLEFIPTESSVEEDYMHKELCRCAISTFNKKYDKLTNETHKAILKLWKESEFKATTIDISKQVNVSQSYVSTVINNFKATLKKELEDMYYD